MLQIPQEILSKYESLLNKNGIQKGKSFKYRKWLRFYLDYCFKYNKDNTDRKNLPLFINKLKEKRQTNEQQKEAYIAVDFYYNIWGPFIKESSEVNDKKVNYSTKKSYSQNTGADWRHVYDDLNTEIKLRHYSPRTLGAYRGWVRQLQNYKKSKDPRTLSTADLKEFLGFLAVEKKSRLHHKIRHLMRFFSYIK